MQRQDWSADEARTVLRFAHHDTWWAKLQAWRATNWAVLLIAAIVGVASLFFQPDEISLASAWHLIGLTLIAANLSTIYLARLHHDMVVSRRNSVKIEQFLSIDQMRTDLELVPASASDPARRGIWFYGLKVSTVTIAELVAVWYMSEPLVGFVAAGSVVVTAAIGLSFALR